MFRGTGLSQRAELTPRQREVFDFIQEKIQEYKESLEITDLIVTRLRLTKVSDQRFRKSLENIASLKL